MQPQVWPPTQIDYGIRFEHKYPAMCCWGSLMVLDALSPGMQQLSVGLARDLHSDKKDKALPMSSRGWPFLRSLSVDWKGCVPLNHVLGHDATLLQHMSELHLTNMSVGRSTGADGTTSI